MPVVFSSAAGSVVRVDVARPVVPCRVDFGQGRRAKFIVTQAAIEQQGSYQFLHSFQDMIHIYVFGDRISQLAVSGVAFARLCNEGGESGMAAALDFYRNNRVAKRANPVKIHFGDRDFEGFLVRSRVELLKPEITLSQWTMLFESFPAGEQRD